MIPRSGPALVVAEISANHSGSLENALKLVEEAAAAGASAVKLQTYQAESITLPLDTPPFLIDETSPWAEYQNLWSIYSEGSTPREWHSALMSEGRRLGIPVFSSPFSPSDVDFLSKLDCPAYKIASPEILYEDLLVAVAETRRPILLSTGVAEFSDVQRAISALTDLGVSDVVLMKCTSCYPSPDDQQNLLTLTDFTNHWNVIPGFSDHTESLVSGAVAAALGAKVIEKHFRGSVSTGLDGFFSLDSARFAIYVQNIREAERLSGSVEYAVAPCAEPSRSAMRSVFYRGTLPAGHVVSRRDLAVVRPSGGGLQEHVPLIVGQRLVADVQAGTPARLSTVGLG